MLQALYHATPKKRKDILIHSSQDFIQTLCEISLYLLKGNITLSPSQFKKLKRQKKIIRLLANQKTSLKRKHQALKK